MTKEGDNTAYLGANVTPPNIIVIVEEIKAPRVD